MLSLLSTQCGEMLRRNHWKVTTAESCTGGGLAQCITSIAGSSEWFEAGFVTYSNAAKIALLNVPAHYLDGPDAPGAVSEETALAMATGALLAADADLALATTGIAGPGGGAPGKPVGTVWIAWAWREAENHKVGSLARLQLFAGDRAMVRRQTVQTSLEGLLQILQDREKQRN